MYVDTAIILHRTVRRRTGARAFSVRTLNELDAHNKVTSLCATDGRSAKRNYCTVFSVTLLARLIGNYFLLTRDNATSPVSFSELDYVDLGIMQSNIARI